MLTKHLLKLKGYRHHMLNYPQRKLGILFGEGMLHLLVTGAELLLLLFWISCLSVSVISVSVKYTKILKDHMNAS